MATQGQVNARQNSLLTAPEATAGTYDSGATKYMATDFGADGNGLTNPQNWDRHKPDGFAQDNGRALTGDEGQLAGNWMPQYALIPQRMNNICGAYTTQGTIDAGVRTKTVWKHPEAIAPNIVTDTLFYGVPGSAGVRCQLGRIRALSVEVMRNGSGGTLSGQIEWHAKDFVRSTTVPASPTIYTGADSPYIEPDHWRIYRAADNTALDAIDMTDAASAALITGAVGHSFSMADLWNPFYSENRSRNASSIVPGARTCKAQITIPRSESGDADYFYDSQDNCTATAFWLRFAAKCGNNEWWIDTYVSRDDTPGWGNDNDVYLNTFMFERMAHATGGLIFTHIALT